MNNADTIGAAFGLLLGLAAQHGPAVTTATADIASVRPIVAIEKAQAAAKAESRRAHASDAEAARVFATTPGDAQDAARGASDAPRVTTSEAAHVDGSEADAAAAAPADAGSDPQGAPEKDVAVSTYDPARHRDPFRPPNLTPTVADSKSGGPRTPLEGYEIGQLKLVGIVKNSTDTRAMVEDSAGLGYIVTTGTPIGTSGGVVRNIETRRMLIEEMTTNFYGEKQAKEVVMELPQEDRSP
jgi:Tfp pilus assembly protein PilP